MPKDIHIKNLPFIEQFSAWKCDIDGDGKLSANAKSKDGKSVNEIALFGEAVLKEELFSGNTNSIWTKTPQKTNDNLSYDWGAHEDIAYAKDVAKEVRRKSLRQDETTKLIENEVALQGKEILKVDIPYWSQRITEVADNYNIPDSVVVSIIGRESKFDKNVNVASGVGPMGVTTTGIRAFFPGVKGNWYDIYNKMDPTLLNDILYKKDENGNFIKDESGNYVLKYESADDLREACTKDDKLGLMVGVMCFKVQYVNAVTAKKLGEPVWKNAPTVIEGMLNGDPKFKLTAEEQKEIISTALKNYNSVFKDYAPEVIKSMEANGLDFEKIGFIKQ